MFSTYRPPLQKPSVRNLRMNNLRGRKKYTKIVLCEYERFDILPCLTKLMETASFPPSQEEIDEFELIDQQRMEARAKGLKACKKIYASGIASSPELKRIRLQICLLNIKIKEIIEGSQAKWKTISHLANVIKSCSWLTFSLAELRCQ
eukprot:3763361-Ditylum_brightwellii.AAC.2